MKHLWRTILILLILCVIEFRCYPNFLTNSDKLGRFKNIYFPIDSWDDFANEIFNYYVFLAPVTSVVTLETTKDLCSGFENFKLNWNSSTPCEDYFCSTKEPYYLEMSKNNNLTSIERENALISHNSLHRFCTLCEVKNLTENFNKTNCKFFNNATCHPNRCNSDQICINFYLHEVSYARPFESNKNSLCYDFKDNSFYNHSDFTHKVIFWIYYRYGLIFCFILELSIFYFSTVCIFLPEIGIIFSKFFILKTTCKEKYFSIVSLRNISFSVMYVALGIGILFKFIDICGFVVIRLSSLWVGACGAFGFFSFSLVIILWQHLLNQSSNMEGSYSLFVK